MLTLRLTHRTESGSEQHVLEIALEGENLTRRTAEARFFFTLSDQDHEDMRWYLENYLQHPYDPETKIAERIEQRLAILGTELFSALFQANDDTRDLWVTMRKQLNETRVEIVTNVQGATAIPWELMRDPKTEAYLALRAQTFVRAHPQPAQSPKLPSLTQGPIRILLVICRPSAGQDVPFRSIASRIVKGLDEHARKMFQLDVLRPATFEKLSLVLEQAKAAGKPYHAVHFDGHGAFLNLSDLFARWQDMPEEEFMEAVADLARLKDQDRFSPQTMYPRNPRPGQRGYLVFENPENHCNLRFVDGPELGSLLVKTDVPLLVVNACRSAHAQAPQEPVRDQITDIHAQVRAFGSLAQEVVDAGAVGVVAMRYNVYVVTAAQFVANLYAALAQGQTLGEAVTQGRNQLAANPLRTIAYEPRALQDWCVPIVYEAAPIHLFALMPAEDGRSQLRLRLDQNQTETQGLDSKLPARPDAGFFGRDETLLALDRAFDTQRVVLLHAWAGSGKTAASAEFARWYAQTGGLTGPMGGAVLFTSFETYTCLRTVLGHFGSVFGPALEKSGKNWLALTDIHEMRALALHVMKQIPVLWIWDNIEPVTGFPAGTESAWSDAEQKELVDFLRDARDTQAKFLLTSRRDEQAWLGNLPARIQIPPMPMQERVQLAQALADKHDRRFTAVADWRPLLEFTQGNPLTITVLVGQTLRDGLHSREHIQVLVERLRKGEAEFEDEASQGRSRSLGASLSYGFYSAFNEDERKILALLHFFQGFVNVDAIKTMGHPDATWSLSELHGQSRDDLINLLTQATDIGLLSIRGCGLYSIHPALPWFFKSVFEHTHENQTERENRVTQAFVGAMTELARILAMEYQRGNREILKGLQVEEKNLLYAGRLARAIKWSDSVIRIMLALARLYEHKGRDPEWSALVDEILPDYIDTSTCQPRSGHESDWGYVAEWRVLLDIKAMKWEEAERLQLAILTWARERAVEALKLDTEKIDASARDVLHSLAVSLTTLGNIQLQQRKSDCAHTFEEALSLMHRIGNKSSEATVCQNLGVAYMDVSNLRNLVTAEGWFNRGIGLLGKHDRLGRGIFLTSLGNVEYERFREARDSGYAKPVLIQHLNRALAFHEEALTTLPNDALPDLAASHNQLGLLYSDGCEHQKALSHFQEVIKYREMQKDYYGAAGTRVNIANTLARIGRYANALEYARAALANFQHFGDRAAVDVTKAQQLIADIEKAMK